MRTPGRQDGFSLVELIVALAVGLMLLGIIYTIFLTTLDNFDRVEATTIVSRDAGGAMHYVTRFIRETQTIEYAGDADITVRADWNDDGFVEQRRYFVDADGRLTEELTNLQTAQVQTLVLADHVVNAPYEPVFEYYELDDSTGDLVECSATDIGGGVMANGDRNRHTDLIVTRLILDIDPYAEPGPYEAATEVYIRNPLD